MVVINGDTGIDKVQDGTITSAKIVNGSVTNDDLATPYRMVLSTPQNSTSGTSIDFTGIPSWVKKIIVMFSGISTSGTSSIQVQLGSGSIQTTGYVSSSSSLGTAVSTTTSTTGIIVTSGAVAANTYRGSVSIDHFGTNTFVSKGIITRNDAFLFPSAGDVTLSGTLDRIRITTVNGTDTFDAGSINIMYEG